MIELITSSIQILSECTDQIVRVTEQELHPSRASHVQNSITDNINRCPQILQRAEGVGGKVVHIRKKTSRWLSIHCLFSPRFLFFRDQVKSELLSSPLTLSSL